jgi:hydrogenase maturation protein HypF
MAALAPGIGEPVRRQRIELRGRVQGVGFRPWVYRQAVSLRLRGAVSNDGGALTIDVEGPAALLERFVETLRRAPPAQARIDHFSIRELPLVGHAEFCILPGAQAGAAAAPLVDLAPCADCVRELFDPTDRRYRYPFISCAACGPRYSIQHRLPWDRAHTSMAGFTMCAHCAREYAAPDDRRFHAQTTACSDCGPQLAWQGAEGARFAGETALRAALDALRDGAIIALKGVGGYQLLVDAANDAAVERLRQRKRRPHKPFALLTADMDEVRQLAEVDTHEAQLLTAASAPIVLLRRRADAAVVDAVAPRNPWLGIMLPASPLHHLLARDAGTPLVATSGNLAGEPLFHADDDAEALGSIADGFLVHDRTIVNPIDDSVLRMAAGAPLVLRLARGMAPTVVRVSAHSTREAFAEPTGRTVTGDLPPAHLVPGTEFAVLNPRSGDAEDIIGLGGFLKNSLAQTFDGGVLVSPYIGDLDTQAARESQRHALVTLAGFAGSAASTQARDLHPDFVGADAAPGTVEVQHHVAHVAGVIAEHGLAGSVLGVAWDGNGYGADGTLWGGEFLRIDADRWERVAHVRSFPLPGGARAMREPWRAALGALAAAFDADRLTPETLPYLRQLGAAERGILLRGLDRGLNAPHTSSVGRLFDAAAALLDLHAVCSFEGQAAIALEAAALDAADCGRGYPFSYARADNAAMPLIIDYAPALDALLQDRDSGAPHALIAARWHAGLAAAIVAVARRLGISQLALSGGCFQNRLLLESTVAGLRAAGFDVFWPRQIPPNDGGLAFGQVAWAARVLAAESR